MAQARKPATYARFLVGMTAAATVPTAVTFSTYASTATAYTDFVTAKGTIVFPAGVTRRVVKIRIQADMKKPVASTMGLRLLSSRPAVLGEKTTQDLVMGGPVQYPAVTYPGPRMGVVGDSIMYANNTYNPPNLIGNYNPPVSRNEYFAVGCTGLLGYANAKMGNALMLEPALQPNTNPGVDSTAPHHGTNFAVYSSKVSQWFETNFDPAPIPPADSHNIGPMLNAINYANYWDMALIMGGTNDLSGGASWSDVLLMLMDDCYQLAALGKWVFIQTLSPRTADLLQAINGVGGYTTAQIATIMQGVLNINQGLRDWISSTKPANIFLVDHWSALVGPTASIIPGTPTDPAGRLSPATGYTVGGTVLPSVPGNFRPDAPDSIFCYDGLHLAMAGAEAGSEVLVAVMKAAGVPQTAVAGRIGPLVIGPNKVINSTMAVTTGLPTRLPGAPVIPGRALCLGSPIPVAGVTGTDSHTNLGAGYDHGVMADYFKLYRGTNLSDGEAFANFNAYTYVSLNDKPNPAPAIFQREATWAAGALKTSIVTIDGKRRFRMVFTNPITGNANEAFVLRYLMPEGQNNVWNNFGFETGGVRNDPAPNYVPGDALSAGCKMAFTGLSSNFSTFRFTANYIAMNLTNDDTDSAVLAGMWGAESFFPFNNIANNQMHTKDKPLMTYRTPAVIAPTPNSNETVKFLQVNWQFSFDGRKASTATIDIWDFEVNAITGSVL